MILLNGRLGATPKTTPKMSLLAMKQQYPTGPLAMMIIARIVYDDPNDNVCAGEGTGERIPREEYHETFSLR
jgi:hypothetical protein